MPISSGESIQKGHNLWSTKNWLSHHLGFEKVFLDLLTAGKKVKEVENKNDNKLYGERHID